MKKKLLLAGSDVSGVGLLLLFVIVGCLSVENMMGCIGCGKGVGRKGFKHGSWGNYAGRVESSGNGNGRDAGVQDVGSAGGCWKRWGSFGWVRWFVMVVVSLGRG